MLAFWPDFFVPPNEPASGMMTGHQTGPRRGTHRAGRIEVGPLHPFPGHAVDIGGFELLLPETGEVSITGVIHHDIDEVGLSGIYRCQGKKEQREKKQDWFHKYKRLLQPKDNLIQRSALK